MADVPVIFPKLILTLQDHDGSHIKGLILNYLDHFYPSLLKIPKFLVEFVTPIVRVRILRYLGTFIFSKVIP